VAKVTGFLEYPREEPFKRPVRQRVGDFREIEYPMSQDRLETQAARCMDCGIPTCHAAGCPVKNVVPDWCDAVYRGRWKDALELLHATDNLPEITGRVCPAPCEPACTLSINQPAVTIRNIELQIVERGWREGWIVPRPPRKPTGRRVAVVGSGPAGLAAAQQLARAGHRVVVFEKSDRIGGLLRYGIPDFKLEKSVIDRRLGQMKAEGVEFETGVDAGTDISLRYLRHAFDAVLLTAGAGKPRDLPVPGRDLHGIHFAMDFLTQSNRRAANLPVPADREITAKGKRVVVLGGGDTGADCLGTSHRQGCVSLTQVELLPQPPNERPADNPWPTWPQVLRSSSSHEEGGQRMWSVLTKEFAGEDGRVAGIKGVRLDWSAPDASGRRTFREVPGSSLTIPADLVLLAMGFVHVEHGKLVAEIEKDSSGNLRVDGNAMTSLAGVFAAGDCVSGASLVVRVIHAGRLAAEGIDRYLGGK
jgi:NAD(P)H-dependent glutamate synthase small subunit